LEISFVGSFVGTHAAITAQTVAFSNLRDSSNLQPTLAQNDIVFVAVENASTIDRGVGALVPSTYIASGAANYQNDTNDSNFQVSYKVMGATPDTTVAIPASNATTAGVAYAIYVFRGVNTVVAGNNNTGIANAPAITPTTAGAWIVAFAGAAVAAGAVFTNPANMSTVTNHFRSATITTTTNDANIGGAIYTAWTSGAFDPAVFGGSTSTNTGSWSAVTIALKAFVATINYTLDGTPGTYAVTGNTASVAFGAKLIGNAGSYSLAGNTADLKFAALLLAEAGSYSINGNSATLDVVATVALQIDADSGIYSLTGGSADLSFGYNVTANAGSYGIIGQDAILSLIQAAPKKGGGSSSNYAQIGQYDQQDLRDIIDIVALIIGRI